MSTPIQQPDKTDNESILNAYLEHVIESGIELYDHQEEAILELYEGNNVLLNTPTGSGKSMVASALHFKSLCQGRTSYYTVPIKALANEKFLSLCQTFGPENVGMITGDATVNSNAPILCCTAEILANIALREGHRAKVDDVIMDEFHYYSDPERGHAWQVPLLTLPQARFLLMSATMGNTDFFVDELTKLTGAKTSLIQSDQRPVPLEYQYSVTPLQENIQELVDSDKAPIYLVHFGQLAAAKSAQNLLSNNLCSKEERQAIATQLHQADFNSPYGKEVAKLLKSGIGIHHAGLLPKYRILVEKLTQQGLLKVICGTDTLGVGVNVPIRTVLFTQLCKFDGSGTRILPVRDFKQIAGRAGRRGFDTKGYVVCQAPDHVIENIKLEAKAAASSKKKKVVKKKPPEFGYVAWSEETFNKLISSEPEKLSSKMLIRHNTILNVLGRTSHDGCAELQRIIAVSHETDKAKKSLRRKAASMFTGLVRGGVLTIIPPHQRSQGIKVKLNIDLQEDFTMNQALGLYLIEALPQLDSEDGNHVLNVLSLVESIIEHPHAILKAQVHKAKGDLMAELKEDGCSYEERMEKLELVEWPKPGAEFIYNTFNTFRTKHPWLAAENIRPKSIAREMYENYYSFEDYIKTYKLERSEAVLVRHLSEVYKVLNQTLPQHAKTEFLIDCERHFQTMLLDIDSSLIDEWEKLKDPNYQPKEKKPETASPKPISKDKSAFRKSIHKSVMQLLKSLSEDDIDLFVSLFANRSEIDREQLNASLDQYYDTHQFIRIDPEARSNKHLRLKEEPNQWQLELTLTDPEEQNDWTLLATVDCKASDTTNQVVLHFQQLRSLI